MKNNQTQLMSHRNEINIAIIGTVSAGKSTLMNTLFTNQYSDMKIKRTTMQPQVYYEVNDLEAEVAHVVTKKFSEVTKIESDKTLSKSDEPSCKFSGEKAGENVGEKFLI